MGLFKVRHIAGKNNSSDIFTKEDKDTVHYLDVRDSMMDDGYAEALTIELIMGLK